MSFQDGDHALLTFDRARPARTELILPVTVVEDSPERTMVYLAAGTPTRALLLADGSTMPRNTPYRELASMDRVLGDTTWSRTNVLICWKAEWEWDVRFMWDAASGAFLCWYVNIQDQVRRTETGFNTTDHFLDIVVSPDKTWALKDEAEFDDSVQLGMYTHQEVEIIRKSSANAIQHIELEGWPFNAGLEGFNSDSAWHSRSFRMPAWPERKSTSHCQ